MTLQQKIERLKKLEKDATKGPWCDHNWDKMERPHVVAETLWDGKSSCNGSFDVPCTYENTEFIAETRNALPELLEALEEAIEIIQVTNGTIKECGECFKDDDLCGPHEFLKKHGIKRR